MAVESIAAIAGGATASADGGRSISLSPMTNGGAPTSNELQMKFSNAVDKAEMVASVGNNELPAPVRGLFNALDNVNVQAKSVTEYAKAAEASGGQLTPGEIVQLTMKAHEFMFQAQLTSNIANRSSDGVQQLFRQQG